jgi:tRNA (cmo5U34)-methyltransferase
MQDKDITRNMTGKWEFNEEVTECFEEMLSRSIPDYQNLRKLITDISVTHINDNYLQNTNILDLGSSQGRQIELLAEKLKTNKFYGIEKSEAMVNYSREKLAANPNIKILNLDLRKTPLPQDQYGLITSILTIQFIPIEYRQKIITNIHQSLHKKGLFIFVEKIIGNNQKITEIYEKQYYKMKKENGYTKQEIQDKKQKLEGVLIPLTNQSNIELLKQAGFTKIDIFWKTLNFIGYIAMK